MCLLDLATKSILRIASIKLNYFLIKSQPLETNFLIKSLHNIEIYYIRENQFLFFSQLFFFISSRYLLSKLQNSNIEYQINFLVFHVSYVHNKNANSREEARERERKCFTKAFVSNPFWLTENFFLTKCLLLIMFYRN